MPLPENASARRRALPTGYRTIAYPCPECSRTVHFATWTGAEALPMKLRCGCNRIVTHAEVLAYWRSHEPSPSPGTADTTGGIAIVLREAADEAG